MFYTVSEMAKIMNVTPSTLRYYDREGLLPQVERTESGIRMFKESDYEWLCVIECLKKTGMSLKDIKRFIEMVIEGDATIAERLEMIRMQQESVKKQIKELEETLETLDFKEWYYDTAKQAGSTSVPRNMPVEQIPPRLRRARNKLKIIHWCEADNQ